jgi:hypothetical protein
VPSGGGRSIHPRRIQDRDRQLGQLPNLDIALPRRIEGLVRYGAIPHHRGEAQLDQVTDVDVGPHYPSSGTEPDRSTPSDISHNRPEHVVIRLVQERAGQIEHPGDDETRGRPLLLGDLAEATFISCFQHAIGINGQIVAQIDSPGRREHHADWSRPPHMGQDALGDLPVASDEVGWTQLGDELPRCEGIVSQHVRPDPQSR